MANLLPRIEEFARIRVVVVGDAMLDGYLRGTTERLCREAPVPVLAVDSTEHVPGGAANVAANVRSLGASVEFVAVVGADDDGALLRAALADRDVSTEHLVTDPTLRTPAKRRLVAGEHMLVRFDEGRPHPVTGAAEEAVLRRLEQVVPAADVVIVSDYEYGVMTDRVVARLAELHRAGARVLVVDAKSVLRYAGVGATAVKPNYDEVRPLLPAEAPRGASRPDDVLAAADRLPEVSGAHIVAVTLDDEGAVICERGRPPYRTYSRPTSSSRACGAGDSYTAALALALASGADTPEAAELASGAAAVILGRAGTSVCSADDLREHLAGTGARLEDVGRLAARREFHRRQGRRLVFTNGCFDILHRGHVDFLNQAKALGDVLVVGLNSDDSVRRLKGPERPVNRLEDRAEVLAALSCVDHLVAFDGDTAVDLLDVLRPDVYVKGGDYTTEMLPEAPTVARIGATVRILPYLEDRSTTGIITRIRGGESYASGPGAASVPARGPRP